MRKKQYCCIILVVFLFALITAGCRREDVQEQKPDEEQMVLNWTLAGLPGYAEDSISRELVEQLNQGLEEKEKEYRIQFHVLGFDEGQMTEEIEETLKTSDLITITNQYNIIEAQGMSEYMEYYPTLTECAEKGVFEPLDSYLDTEDGRKLKEAMLTELTLKPGFWDGKQWLLSTGLPGMAGSSVGIKKELYDKGGLDLDTVPDFTQCDELFAQLYKTNDNQPFLIFSDKMEERGINGMPEEVPVYLGQMLKHHESLWESTAWGIGSLKTEGTDLDTRNLLREPYFEHYLNAWKRYMDKGYVHSDINEEVLAEPRVSVIPETVVWQGTDGEWVIPKSEQYVMHLKKHQSISELFNGIGSRSKKKDLAFEALADMIIDDDINELLQQIDAGNAFVFMDGLSKEGKAEYLKLIETVPKYTSEYVFDTFSAPEIAEVNKVFAEYGTEAGTNGSPNVLEKYYSENGKVTEESIRAGIQRLNEKLEKAGIDRLAETLKEHKK